MGTIETTNNGLLVNYQGVEGYTFGWLVSEIKVNYLAKVEQDWLNTLYGIVR